MAQVVECLPSKCKAMNSNPNIAKKKKKKTLKIMIGLWTKVIEEILGTEGNLRDDYSGRNNEDLL
jgi:hypothetical protein